MPQPLSRVRSDGGVYLGNYGMKPHPFQERPELAFMILEVISRYSLVESFLLKFYATLLGGPKEIAAQMYLNMETKTEKTRALNTVASNLSGEARIAFDKLRKDIATIQKTRDKFAHGIWGIHIMIPDGILWCDTKFFVEMEVPLDLNSISVYYVNDMTSALTSLDEIHITSQKLEELINVQR